MGSTEGIINDTIFEMLIKEETKEMCKRGKMFCNSDDSLF
jgi:hypothetical protein